MLSSGEKVFEGPNFVKIKQAKRKGNSWEIKLKIKYMFMFIWREIFYVTTWQDFYHEITFN